MPLLIFIHSMKGLLKCKYGPFWQEVSLESLIPMWPLRPVGLLFWNIPVKHMNAFMYLYLRHRNCFGLFDEISCYSIQSLPSKPIICLSSLKLKLDGSSIIFYLVAYIIYKEHIYNVIAFSLQFQYRSVEEKDIYRLEILCVVV